MYKPRDRKTPPLFLEPFSLAGELDPDNRWLRLAALVPWAAIEEAYESSFSRFGRPAKDARLVCGLLIVKWLEDYSDERTVQELRENPYLQSFCGFHGFVSGDEVCEPTLLSRARRKIGRAAFAAFEDRLLDLLRASNIGVRFPRSAPKKRSLAETAGNFFEKLGRSLFRE